MIKALPEDFIVEEKAALPLAAAGPYRVYRLTKVDWTTPDLVRHLARAFGVSPTAISYGGKKDKHGRTSQHIAVRDARDFSREENGFRLTALGFMARPMGPDLLLGNAFRIVLRDLAETAPVERALAEVRETGFPNYFDDQRFRSYDPERGFFAEKILRRHWNGALQVFLTSTAPGMWGPEKIRRRELFDRWKDWPRCLELARGGEEREIFEFLTAHPKDQVKALHKLPQEEISMRYSSFQSHLWNELLRAVVRETVAAPASVPGAEGEYLYWTGSRAPAAAGLLALDLPTCAARMEFPDDRTRDLFAGILQSRSLKFGDFRTRALHRVYFKSFPRPAAVKPENPVVLETGIDELNRGRRRLTLSFALPRGSYATILIKKLCLGDAG
ncbi:MAG: tRNA pseudouridine(13) synthase TruD [Acidobacteriota bacterium]|nr:tRNA pseudouridine(13) synthase TruD [Acidobacteriota bacterium]